MTFMNTVFRIFLISSLIVVCFCPPFAFCECAFVLTGNPSPDEIGLSLGCSYTAEPAFTNPPDPQGKRLIDGNRPNNWRTVAGINKPSQTLVFDLTTPCRIHEIAIQFKRRNMPASVVIETSNDQSSWSPAGTLTYQDSDWWRIKNLNLTGQYVRLRFAWQKWGWYTKEIKIYGSVLGENPVPVVGKVDTNPLVSDKKVHCQIVVARHPEAHAVEAAGICQKLIHEITGRWVSIVTEDTFQPGHATAILVGQSDLAKAKGIDVPQEQSAGDRYMIQTGKGYIALVGNDKQLCKSSRYYRGSVYAIYDFFERLGCGWYGPDELWQIIPKRSTLITPQISVQEIPSFQWRWLWMHRMNNYELRDAWRLGGRRIFASHCLSNILPPEKYEKQHPEWFGPKQPCMTNPEVITFFANYYRKIIEQSPPGSIVPLSISANDNGGFCSCKSCKALGSVSDRMLHFANAIAKNLNETHRGRFLLTFYAYWYSHAGPSKQTKAEPGVCVMLVNEGNHTKPLDMPESRKIAQTTGRNNTREMNAFRNWRKTGALHAAYEWWIPAVGAPVWKDVPWYSGQTAIRNLRFWKAGGVRYVYYESKSEHNGGFPIRWPLYYMAARGMWDVRLTAKQIMSEACEKLYGQEAAASMRQYYQVLEIAMLRTKGHGSNWHLPSPDVIYTPEIRKKASQYLLQAKSQATNPDALARIEEETKLWNKAIAAIENLEEAENPKQSFDVILNGKPMPYRKSHITGRILLSLFGLPDDTSVEVIELDGQNRPVHLDEEYDLRTKIRFVTPAADKVKE